MKDKVMTEGQELTDDAWELTLACFTQAKPLERVILNKPAAIQALMISLITSLDQALPLFELDDRTEYEELSTTIVSMMTDFKNAVLAGIEPPSEQDPDCLVTLFSAPSGAIIDENTAMVGDGHKYIKTDTLAGVKTRLNHEFAMRGVNNWMVMMTGALRRGERERLLKNKI